MTVSWCISGKLAVVCFGKSGYFYVFFSGYGFRGGKNCKDWKENLQYTASRNSLYFTELRGRHGNTLKNVNKVYRIRLGRYT
jgi:hypothetical protein